MKTRLLSLLIFLSMAAGFFPVSAYDEEVTVNNIKYGYSYYGETATVIGPDSKSSWNFDKNKLVSVEIPEKIQSKNGKDLLVTAVGGIAFENCENLETVVLPSTIKWIGIRSFSGCAKLKSITLPDGLIGLNRSVFSGCESLTSLRLPETLERLEENALSGMESLRSIVIPPSVKKIEYSPFLGCSNLKKVAVPPAWNDKNKILKGTGNEYSGILVPYPEDDYLYEDGFLYSKDYSILYFAPVRPEEPSITITRPVKEIGKNAFYGCRFREVLFEKAPAIIGERAFADSWLTGSMEIPEGVEVLGQYAFYNCMGMEHVTFPETLKEIGDYCFEFSFASFTELPNSLETLGVESLPRCESEVLVIPLSVKNYPQTSFINKNNFGNLQKMVFSNKYNIVQPEYPQDNMIFHCSYPEDAVMEDGFIYSSDYSKLYYAPYYLEGVAKINDSVKEIALNAFALTPGLTGIEFPSALKKIGFMAFYNCDSLESVDMPDSVEVVDEYAFSFCSNLKSLHLSENLKLISEESFDGTTSLKSIVIPDAVTSIGRCAFYKSGIEYIKFGESLRLILDLAFVDCKNLKEVVFPANLKEISHGAFTGCTGLEYVVIPQFAKAYSSFEECTGLKKCAYPSDSYNPFPSNVVAIPYLADGAIIEDGFVYSNDYSHLYFVPTTYSGDYEIVEGCKSIGDYAFYECRDLTSVKIPDSVVMLGSSMFENCRNLTSVNIHEDFNGIPSRTFKFCHSLENFVIPKNAKIIGEEAFYESHLKGELVIPEGVEEIGSRAFFKGFNLDKLYIPGSVTKIGWSAFERCSIKELYYNTTDPKYFDSIFGNSDWSIPDFCVLYVPAGGIEKAHETIPWKKFYEIREWESAGVNGVENDIDDEIDFDAPMEVYDVNGVMVAKSLDSLPSGLYIVRQNGKVRKMKL